MRSATLEIGFTIPAYEETAKLEMDAGVKSILPITFTQEGAVDQISACYMEMPQGGWQQLPAMKLDEGWWEKLQSSC